MKTAKRRISILFIVILCNLCAQVTASTGSYEGVITSVDGCEGGFDNGKHKAGEWRWYCNGWRYLYPGYHEVTLRKREAGYATDKIVVTTDHAFQPSGTGPAASPQESDGKKAHVGKDGMVVAEAENYASLDDRGHVPLSYMQEFYHQRVHMNLVREDVERSVADREANGSEETDESSTPSA